MRQTQLSFEMFIKELQLKHTYAKHAAAGTEYNLGHECKTGHFLPGCCKLPETLQPTFFFK